MFNIKKKSLYFAEKLNQSARQYVNILLIFDPSSDESIVLKLSKLFESNSELSTVDVKSLKDDFLKNLDRYDLCFLLEGYDSQARVLQKQIKDEGLECLLITDVTNSYFRSKRITDYIMFNELQIARWALSKCKSKCVSLSCCFKFIRTEYCRQVVESTTIENSVIGVCSLSECSNMPLMTLNQIKMIFIIAASYGHRINIDRLAKTSICFAGAYASWSFASVVLAKSKFLRRARNASMAAFTTYSMGRTLVSYFESTFADAIEGEIANSVNQVSIAGKKIFKQINKKLQINFPIEKFIN